MTQNRVCNKWGTERKKLESIQTNKHQIITRVLSRHSATNEWKYPQIQKHEGQTHLFHFRSLHPNKKQKDS